MKMRIPEHYTVASVYHPYTNARVVKRGGYIQRVKVELPATEGFTKKFGRRITRLDGDSSGSGGGTFCVHFAWGRAAAARLLQELVSYHWYEGCHQVVTFAVGESTTEEEYDALVTSQGMSADAMIESAAEDVHELCADIDHALWATEEEAQVYLDSKLAEVDQHERSRAYEREIRVELIKAFNQAGFPTTDITTLGFDVKTSKRLIEFLKEPLDV